MTIADRKALLRDTMRERRAAFGRGHEAAFGDAIAANFMAGAENLGLSPGTVVAEYWPIGGEADVRPLLARVSTLGAICALPVIAGRDQALRFRQWLPGDELESAALATRQPTADKPWVTPAIILMPLLAFDARGYRLGQGGGYYDRTLAELKSGGDVLSVGIAYSCQKVTEVPHGTYDMRLDWVATEKALIETVEE
ncbi:MAG: 5-formyltetrahydrofolate cyclo-ligase [Rhodospirillales bacterium]|nr:5-formyltetrahydrofolate cyclo-ligase [Rhodospirillales bacterium]